MVWLGWDPGLRTWFATLEPWPPTGDDDLLIETHGTTPGEIGTLEDLLRRLEADYQLRPPAEVRQALADPVIRTGHGLIRFWARIDATT